MIFTTCLVVDSNSGCSPSSRFLNCPWPQVMQLSTNWLTPRLVAHWHQHPTSLHWTISRRLPPLFNGSVQEEFNYDWMPVGQSSLVLGTPLWPMTRILLLSYICYLHVLGHPLWQDGRSLIYMSNSLVLLGSWTAELMTLICRLAWDSRDLEAHVPIFISSTHRVSQLNPRVLGSHFVSFYDSQGYLWCSDPPRLVSCPFLPDADNIENAHPAALLLWHLHTNGHFLQNQHLAVDVV